MVPGIGTPISQRRRSIGAVALRLFVGLKLALFQLGLAFQLELRQPAGVQLVELQPAFRPGHRLAEIAVEQDAGGDQPQQIAAVAAGIARVHVAP